MSGTSDQPGEKNEVKNLNFGWATYLLLAIIAFLIIINLIRSTKNDSNKKTSDQIETGSSTKTKSTSSSASTIEYIDVSLNSEYQPISIGSDVFSISFIEATVPYSVKSSGSEEYSSENIEDISYKFTKGKSEDYLILYLKCQKEPGKLKIRKIVKF